MNSPRERAVALVVLAVSAVLYLGTQSEIAAGFVAISGVVTLLTLPSLIELRARSRHDQQDDGSSKPE